MSARTTSKRRILVVIAGALLLNLLAGFVFWRLLRGEDRRLVVDLFVSLKDRYQQIQMAAREEQVINLELIQPSVPVPGAIAPSLTPEVQLLEEEKIEEAKKPEEDPKANGQVVEIAPPAIEVRPDDADFLSEYDSKVDKETKANGQVGAPEEKVRPAPPKHQMPMSQDPSPPRQEKGTGGARQLTMRGEQGRGKDAGAGKTEGTGKATEGKEKGEKSKDGDLPEGEKSIKGEEGTTKAEEQGQKGGGQGQEGGGAGEGTGDEKITMDDLRPSEDAIQRTIGSGSSDYLKDIDEGEQTLLNTKRWKFANFFNRVKRAVAQSWHPDVAYRLRDPTGQIYGHKNRLTILRVSLHPDGSVRDILIEKPCGIDFLDDEAVKAFKDAQPFPNPPGGLVSKESNLITFRFGFYFEISASPTFKVFRYSN